MKSIAYGLLCGILVMFTLVAGIAVVYDYFHPPHTVNIRHTDSLYKPHKP
jgi:hypothetical protein